MDGSAAGRRQQPEYRLHCVISDWLRLAVSPDDCFWTTVDAGGWRHMATAGRMKRVGVRAGFPDLLLIPANGPCFGVELKAEKGRLSPEQVALHLELLRVGIKVFTCRSLDEVQMALNEMAVPVRDRNARRAA